MQNSPVAVGQTIAQKYQIEKVIGEGGMGLVVAAWHLGLQQRVAIKFVLADVARDHDGSSERFRREARAAARIRSEHVCRVLDVGALDNGVPYMVMEYMEGCDLAAELQRQGRLSISDALEYVLQACEALAEAHVAGIVHRDLKPANLFLARRADGTRAIKVLDFGVSKSLTEAGISHLSLTQSAALIGSPIYMSPEQLESSKDVDARTDIWALGTILYELLSGRTPFDGSSIPQLVNAVLNSEPARFAQLGVGLPAGLEAVVLRALTKDRDQRYASVAEFAQDLGPFAPAHASVSVSRIARVIGPTGRERSAVAAAVRVVGGTAERPAPTPQPVERISTHSDRRPTSRWRWALLLLVPILIGVGVQLSRLGGGSSAAPPPTASAVVAPVVQLPAGDAGAAAPSLVEAQAAAEAPDAGHPEEARPVAAAPSPAVAPGAVAPAVPTSGSAPAARVAAPAAPTDSALPRGVDFGRAKRPDADTPRRAPAQPAPAAQGISDFGGRR